MKKPSKNINTLLEQHFKEDKKCFSDLNSRSDRFEKLLGQMGEHLSFLRRDMNIITKTQEKHAEESSEFRKLITQTMEKIKESTDPLVKEDMEEKVTNARIAKWGETGVSIIKAVLAFGAFCTMVWAVFKYIILKALE